MSQTNQDYTSYGQYPDNYNSNNGSSGWATQPQIPQMQGQPGPGSYNYYYRQQVSAARPRHIPPPLSKPGLENGFYGNSGDFSFVHNSSASGRSNKSSPTYFGLTEVLASYLPADSTVLYMDKSKSKQKWRLSNLTIKFMASFFAFTIIVSAFFLLRNGMLTNFGKGDEDTLFMGDNPSQSKPRSSGPPPPNNAAGNQRELPKASPTLNNNMDSENEIDEDCLGTINADDQEVGPIRVLNGEGEKPVKIIYSVDEEDGEVHIESVEYTRY